jgi:hypothetical protein
MSHIKRFTSMANYRFASSVIVIRRQNSFVIAKFRPSSSDFA